MTFEQKPLTNGTRGPERRKKRGGGEGKQRARIQKRGKKPDGKGRKADKQGRDGGAKTTTSKKHWGGGMARGWQGGGGRHHSLENRTKRKGGPKLVGAVGEGKKLKRRGFLFYQEGKNQEKEH